MAIPAWLPFAGDALSAGAQIGSAYIGAKSSEKMTRQTNEANLAIAKDNREWQEHMDNTRFQRGRRDAEAAGFNPILATGSPATTPFPSSAVMENPAPNRGELYLSTAKSIADVLLTKEMAKTEKVKQATMAGEVADAKNREKYASSRVGKAMAWPKGILSDLGGAIAAGLGFAGGTASQLARGSRVIKGFADR